MSPQSMLRLLVKNLFLLLSVGCGEGTSPRERDEPLAEKISVQCVVSQNQRNDLRSEPLALIRQVLASEPFYEKKQFSESLSAWQACYENI